MKKIRYLFLIVFFATLSSTAFSQTKDVVYIRIQENIGSMDGELESSYMCIVNADQTTKFVELKKLWRDGVAAEENGILIQSEVARLIKSGYELKSSSVGADSIYSTTVMIFVKEE